MTDYDHEFKKELIASIKRLCPVNIKMPQDLFQRLFPEQLVYAPLDEGGESTSSIGAHRVTFHPIGAMPMVQFFGAAVRNNDVMRYDPPLESALPPDAINPDHYKTGGIEVIDILKIKLTKDQFDGFLMGNVIKYTLRAGKKNGIEDLKKAAWYGSMLSGVDPRSKP